MKKSNILLILFIGFVFGGCETNDPLKDLSTLGKQAPNIYFLPIDPVVSANSEVQCEIEYWTVDNKIKNQSLWNKTYLTEEYSIEIKDVPYEYINSFDTLLVDWEMYKEYDFDFTDWTPDRNAYVFKTKYYVDGSLGKKTYKQTNTGKEAFSNLISSNAIENIYKSLLNNKSVLKAILVDNNSTVNEDTFNSWYSGGKLSGEGYTAAKSALSSINTKDLIGDKYSKKEAYKVYLKFKIINGFDEENSSLSRSFKVK